MSPSERTEKHRQKELFYYMGNNCLWLSSVCGVPSLGPSTFYYLSILGVPGTKACDNLKERKRHVVAQSHSLTLCDPMDCSTQVSLSLTISQSLLKLMSIELVMPSNHLIFCHPLLLLPSIFPSIRVFSNELALPIRWPKYWSFSFSISPSNEYSGLIS